MLACAVVEILIDIGLLLTADESIGQILNSNKQFLFFTNVSNNFPRNH